MKAVDQAVRFVELVAQAGHAPAGNQCRVTLHTSRAVFGRFHFLGDFIDMRVQRLKEFPCLRRVGVIDHVGIIASTTVTRAPGLIQQISAGDEPPLPRQRCRSSLLTSAIN